MTIQEFRDATQVVEQAARAALTEKSNRENSDMFAVVKVLTRDKQEYAIGRIHCKAGRIIRNDLDYTLFEEMEAVLVKGNNNRYGFYIYLYQIIRMSYEICPLGSSVSDN